MKLPKIFRKKQKVVVATLEHMPLDDFEKAKARYQEAIRQRKQWMEIEEWTNGKRRMGREIEAPRENWKPGFDKREIIRRLDKFGYAPPDEESDEEEKEEETQEVETAAVEQKVEKEKLVELYMNLASNFEQFRTTQTLPECLQGVNAQQVVDFLNEILDRDDVLPSNERKRALHILCKIAKTTQVFPKSFELTGVECDLGNSIKGGGFGLIYKGVFRGEAVCVKAVRAYRQVDTSHGKRLRAHAGELLLGTHLLHPNVLPIYGAFSSGEEVSRICIVSPWMEGGTLVDHLDEHPDTPRVPLVTDILSGLNHMHEMEIVHSDLKGSNVLISRAQRAVLADFGVSRVAMASPGTTTAADASGTVNWMAPELLDGDLDEPVSTFQSDIWAIGCICYEILAGEPPFSKYPTPQLIRAFMKKENLSRPKPTITIPYTDEIWTLAEKCLSYDPLERPTAEAALKNILELKVKDDRPPAAVDPGILVKGHSKGTSEIEYNNLVSIIQQIQETNEHSSIPDLT